jgi:hypothetical protein
LAGLGPFLLDCFGDPFEQPFIPLAVCALLEDSGFPHDQNHRNYRYGSGKDERRISEAVMMSP